MLVLRSTSMYIRDVDGKVIGALCINFDITDFMMAEKIIGSMIGSVRKTETVREIFSNDVDNLLDTLIKESIRHVGKPVTHMSKDDNVEGIRYLDRKGAFLVKKAGPRISKHYGISKYTLYAYLEED